MQDKITIADAPECLNTNDKAMWVLGYQAALAARSTCLHRIQVPSAAEQAAWHAGLDEGRTQAAPAAVAVPDVAAALDRMDALLDSDCGLLTVGPDSATVQASRADMLTIRAALAATPAAVQTHAEAAAALGINSALTRIRAGNHAEAVAPLEHALRALAAAPSAERIAATITNNFRDAGWSMPSIDEARVLEAVKSALSTAPAAAAPVVLPEPDAVISEVMGLMDEWGMESHLRGEAELDAQHSEATQEEIDCAKDRASKERAAWKAIESKLRSLLAGVSAPAAMAVNLLAADHSGMKVDYRGLFSQVQRAIKRSDPGYAEMLRQLEGHLQELGQRWYAGDTNVVDEILQLYCIERDARKTVRQDAAAAPQAQADAREAQLLAFAVSEIRRDEMEQAPVLYVSKGQLDNHRDPDGPNSANAGRYLPARITPAGNFTMPLFAAPQAQADARDAERLAFVLSEIRRDCMDSLMAALFDEDGLPLDRQASVETIDRASIAAAKGE